MVAVCSSQVILMRVSVTFSVQTVHTARAFAEDDNSTRNRYVITAFKHAYHLLKIVHPLDHLITKRRPWSDHQRSTDTLFSNGISKSNGPVPQPKQREIIVSARYGFPSLLEQHLTAP